MSKTISKIQCFECCHMRYKLSYIDNLEQESSSIFEKGKTLHYILEKFNYFEIIKGFIDSDVGAKFYTIIKDSEKEKRIGLKIQNNNLITCSFNDCGCMIRGVIDAIYKNNIIDYKSGKYVTYNNQNWLQLEFYALWLFLNSNYDEIKVSYLYIEHNKENTRIIKRSECKDIIKNIFTRINDIIKYEQSPDDSHNVSALCDYCTVRHHCPHYKDDTVLLNKVDIQI